MKKPLVLDGESPTLSRKIEISRRSVFLLAFLLVLSSIAGWTGILIAQAQETKIFEATLEALINEKGRSNEMTEIKNNDEHWNEVNSSALVRNKRDVRSLYCPTGGEKNFLVTDDEIKNGHVMREFEKYCQCKHGATCRRNTAASRYDCSRIQDLLENHYDVKDACIIHDICYATGRAKSSCDTEFHHNFKQVCYENAAGIAAGAAVGAVGGTIAACAIPIINIIACPIVIATAATAGPVAAVAIPAAIGGGAIGSCSSMADIAYYAVRDHGTTHGDTCFTSHGEHRSC